MANQGILVVEDNTINLRTLEHELSEEGYFSFGYRSGKKVIEEVENGLKYGLAIVDLELPGAGGDEVITSLKKINPIVPVYAMSGYNLKTANAKMKNSDGFFSKPVDVDELIMRIKDCGIEPQDDVPIKPDAWKELLRKDEKNG